MRARSGRANRLRADTPCGRSYAVEMFSPPYMNLVRPNYYDQPANLLYAKSYSIGINVLRSAKVVQAVIMDLGYSTHGVHMSSRYVELEVKRTATHRLTITGPKDEALYPPGTCIAAIELLMKLNSREQATLGCSSWAMASLL